MKKWIPALLLSFVISSLPLQAKAAPSGKDPLPEYKYETFHRQSNDPLAKQPEVKPGKNIPDHKKWDVWSLLQVRVIDAATRKPLPDAEVVVAENGYRTKTDKNGYTSAFPAPVIRDPRFSETLARLHGQLTLIAYKNGYRDTVYFNVRMHEGVTTTPEMWMYQITPQDRRIEPHVYFYPTHRIFVINLAEQFRSKTQPGAGPESPNR